MRRSRPCLALPPALSPSTMNSSLSAGSVDEQSASLPGRLSRCETAGLARHRLRGGAAGLARAGRQDHAGDEPLGHRAILGEPLLQRGPHRPVDLGGDLRVVEPVLGLALELRLGDVDRDDRGQPLTDVLGGERHALGPEVVHLDEVAHRLDDAALQAALVRAAGAGGDAVDVALDVLVGGLGPLERALDDRGAVGALVAREIEGALHRMFGAVGDDLGQVVGDAAVVREGGLVAADLVLEHHLEAAVEVGLGLQPIAHLRGIELRARAEDLVVGAEQGAGAGAARLVRRHRLQLRDRRAARVALRRLHAVAPHRHHHLRRQRVHHRAAHAVQPAGVQVVLAAELAARVERGEDHLERALVLELRHRVDRDAAPVVLDGDAAPVLVQRDPDGGGVTVDHLVDRVVDDLPQQVMVAAPVDAADVHGGPLADRLEPLENLDVLSGVCHGELGRLRGRWNRRHRA